MHITILFFGIATDLIGKQSINFPLEASIHVENFKVELLKAYPNLNKMDQYAIAINEAYAEEKSTIKPGDTIAIIPPVSGG